MELVNQLLAVLQQGLSAIFHFIELVWRWSVTQISLVPWNRLSDLPLYKVVVLVICGAAVAFFIYRAARELLVAGEKALSAFVTLLTVLVRTLPPILLAGGAAAAGAWAVNNLKF
jgi:hypothetical protein